MKILKALLGVSSLMAFSIIAACSGGDGSSVTGSTPEALGYSGGFVDMHGNGSSSLLVGAPGKGDSEAASGSITAFDSASSPLWTKAGDLKGAQLGFSFANLGDINGDGKAEFAVGAINDTGEAPFSGTVYVYKGGSSDPALLVKLNGANPMDKFGWAITGGDVNADGINDIIVSAALATGSSFQSGLVYVYFGGSAISTTPNLTLKASGMSLATGDVNGDGAADLLIGGGSKVSVFYGGSGFSSHGSSADMSISGAKATGSSKAGSGFGNAIAYLGDINGDGFGDIAVANPTRSDPDTYDNIGSIGIYSGSDSYPSSIFEDDEAYRLVKIIGDAKGDRFGFSLATAGDVNGGGLTDFLVGAEWADGSTKGSGKIYLFHTEDVVSKSGVLNSSAVTARTYVSAGNGSELGKTISVNSSGEFFAGAPYGNSRSGAAYVFNIATGAYREITN